jgi:hypothetical protein
MATIAALIGANVISGIGGSIADGFREQQRRNEWNQIYDFNKNKFDFQSDFANRQLKQTGDLTSRGQSLNFGSNMLTAGMQTGGSFIGNLLSYKHSQDQLNFQKELNSQRRSDFTNEGLPLSYLHMGGSGFSRSVPLPMARTQTMGRSTSNPWGFANSGSNLRDTYGPPPTGSTVHQTHMNAPNQLHPGFDSTSGFPK